MLKRRSFLKGLAGAAVLPFSPQKTQASESLAASVTSEPLTTVLDIDKCIGCGECVAACAERNQKRVLRPVKPLPQLFPDGTPSEDWSEKMDVDDRLTPYNWLFIQSCEVEYEGEVREVFMPRRCMHCVNPLCVNDCPMGAASQAADGTVSINSDFCFGGAVCRQACPWNIPQRQSGVGLYLHILPRFMGNGCMFKCDRCGDSMAHGEIPACIAVCPEKVQRIGPRSEMIALAQKMAEERKGFIWGMENGGTNTLYVSSVPFDLISKAVEKGSGRPAVQEAKKEDSGMQDYALALAPLAGIIAGAAAAYKAIRESSHD